MKRLLKIGSLSILALLGAFTATALAAQAVVTAQTSAAADLALAAPDPGLLELLRPVYDALVGGHRAYAGALLVVALAAIAKRRLSGPVPWLHSDAGGSALALVMASASALATGLAAPSATLTWGAFTGALVTGVVAAGGFAVVKNLLIDPVLRPLAAKAPTWTQPFFSLIFWVFDKKSPADVATQVGTTAVNAAPGAGVTGIVGAPLEIK